VWTDRCGHLFGLFEDGSLFMTDWSGWWPLLAEAGAQNANPDTGFGGQLLTFVPLIIIVLLYVVLMGGGRRREEKKQQQFLASLKKNDRVVTVGGIIGTVANISDKEVTLKVDDNTKLRFLRSSIHRVLGAESDSPAT
jgi:preprotein translocase subunit YajC